MGPTRAARDLREAIAAWRQVLAGSGLGLVEVAAPSRFSWPGYWIAVVRVGAGDDEAAVLVFGTPPGIVLSPAAPELMSRPTAELDVVAGYVVAALDPAAAPPSAAPGGVGVVEGIAVAPAATVPMRLVTSARALAGRGLQGDRYADGAGTFSSRTSAAQGYDLTLIEAEVLDHLELAAGVRLSHGDSRRNILTRGIDLGSLVGRHFRIGDVECVGRRPCEPCAHLERLTYPGVLKALIHRGGLRADIVSDGTIDVGDEIRPVG